MPDPRAPVPITSASPSHLENARGDIELAWRGERLGVYAHSMARTLFTTASIDVLLDGRLLVATGGQRKATGSASARFTHEGQEHGITVSWERFAPAGFPVTVLVDGELVGTVTVPVRGGWKLLLLPLALFVLGMLIAALDSALR